MGIELLPARDPRRSDCGQHRRPAFVGIRRLFGRFAARGLRRTGDRARDRSPRRPRGAGALERRAGGRSRPAGCFSWPGRAVRRLGHSRHRHVARALRCGLRHTGRALWSRGEGPDHRHHPVRRFRLNRKLAVVDVPQRCGRLARDRAGLGRAQYRDRYSAQSAAAGAATTAPGVAPRRPLDRLEAVPRDVPAGVRVRGGLVRHRRDGGAPAAPARDRRRDPGAGHRRGSARRAGAGGGASGGIFPAAPRPSAYGGPRRSGAASGRLGRPCPRRRADGDRIRDSSTAPATDFSPSRAARCRSRCSARRVMASAPACLVRRPARRRRSRRCCSGCCSTSWERQSLRCRAGFASRRLPRCAACGRRGPTSLKTKRPGLWPGACRFGVVCLSGGRRTAAAASGTG